MRNIRYGPDTFVQIISEDDGFLHILNDEITVKLNLIREAASDSVGCNFVALTVDTHIKRFDLSIVIKGSDDGNNLHRHVVV